MSELTDRMTGLKQLTFLLPGFSVLYPLFAFPTYLAMFNSSLVATGAVVLGLLIYAVPANWVSWVLEKLTWRFGRAEVSHKIYEQDIKNLVEEVSGKTAPLTYSIFYVAYLPQRLRERIDWLLSLHYFYSRVSLVALAHFVFFLFPVYYLGVFLWRPDLLPMKVGPIVHDEPPESLFLKCVTLLASSAVLTFLLFFPARRTLQKALRTEKAAIPLYRRDLDDISRGNPPT